MPWCPPELRPRKVRRVKVNEDELREAYKALVGQTITGRYTGVYQVPISHPHDERRVDRGTIEVTKDETQELLRTLRDSVESETFWSGITCPKDDNVCWLWCLEPVEYTSVGQRNHFYVSDVTFFKESEYRAEAEIKVVVVA